MLARNFALGAASLALLATPASAQLRVGPLADIYESYNDCFAVTNTGSLTPAALADSGWQRATISGGGNAGDQPIIYGHAERAPLIMLSAESGDGACIVVARLENREAFVQLISAWGLDLDNLNDGAVTFFAEERPVQISATGTDNEPSATLAVGTRMESE